MGLSEVQGVPLWGVYKGAPPTGSKRIASVMVKLIRDSPMRLMDVPLTLEFMVLEYTWVMRDLVHQQ